MHPGQRACIHQQKRVKLHAEASDSYAFFNLLTGPEFLDQVELLLPEHRERLFPPTETLSMFLAQAMSADRSCQSAVDAAAIQRLMMAQAALLTDIIPRRLSFKHTLQLWIAWRQSGTGSYDDSKPGGLFILIAQQQIGNRPGRIEPRAVKRRPEPFPLLTKPRHIAREEVRKHGHPKKLK